MNAERMWAFDRIAQAVERAERSGEGSVGASKDLLHALLDAPDDAAFLEAVRGVGTASKSRPVLSLELDRFRADLRLMPAADRFARDLLSALD